MKHRIIATALFCAVWIVAGCATDAAPPPVPGPIAEPVPKPPVSATALIWQPGHWDWSGSSYAWVPGQYVARSGHGDLWMPAWWEKTAAGWVWHPAHWV
jgi:hypothetical protein